MRETGSADSEKTEAASVPDSAAETEQNTARTGAEERTGRDSEDAGGQEQEHEHVGVGENESFDKPAETVRPKSGRQKKAARRPGMFIWIFLLTLVISLVPLFFVYFIMLDAAENVQLRSTTSAMKSQALGLADRMAASDYFANTSDRVMNALIDQAATNWTGRIQVIDASYRIVQDTYIVDIGKYSISEDVINCLTGRESSGDSSYGDYLEFTQPITKKTEGENPLIMGLLLVTVDKRPMTVSAASLSEKLLQIELIIFVVLVLVALVIANRLVHPLKKLRSQIRRFEDEDPEDPVRVRTYRETAEIGDSFNRTYQRLSEISRSRQEFIANVSHELKTPITSIRVLADSLMGMEDVPVELYREFMSDISDEIDRESKIIEDLLSLTRLESKTDVLDITRTNVNASLELILKRLRPIARQRNIELVFESFRPVTAEIDEPKFALAITNLIENAIKYNVDDGWVKLSLNADYQYFFVKVSDSGVGIPEDVRERIFDRFYRVDKARSRETGGTGLGLSITRSIVAMHHGAIRVYSREGEGTTFVVRTPLTYIKE